MKVIEKNTLMVEKNSLMAMCDCDDCPADCFCWD